MMGEAGVFIDHVSKFSPLLLLILLPFVSNPPPSLFGDRLSYTAPSVTDIPSRFHGDQVRGGHSLLAVVCNHHERAVCLLALLPLS